MRMKGTNSSLSPRGRVLQTALENEMTNHLGYEQDSSQGWGSGNSRNGQHPKRWLLRLFRETSHRDCRLACVGFAHAPLRVLLRSLRSSRSPRPRSMCAPAAPATTIAPVCMDTKRTRIPPTAMMIGMWALTSDHVEGDSGGELSNIMFSNVRTGFELAQRQNPFRVHYRTERPHCPEKPESPEKSPEKNRASTLELLEPRPSCAARFAS